LAKLEQFLEAVRRGSLKLVRFIEIGIALSLAPYRLEIVAKVTSGREVSFKTASPTSLAFLALEYVLQ
jgi:hypothetical protein